jgi:predicted Zn-dependent protease
MALVTALFLLLSSCAFIDFNSPDEKRAQAILMMESQVWQKQQEQRMLAIAARLLAAAETVEPLRFHFAARIMEGWTRIDADAVNAWTDGEGVWVSRGMMRFLKGDNELALVLAHEMAHAYRGHIAVLRAKQIIEAGIGAVLDWLSPGSGRAAVLLIDAATKKFDRDQEREADLYGLIWAHKAGFDVSGGRELWRRMAIEIPESIESGFLSSHPSSAERFLLLDKFAAMLKEGAEPSELIASAKGRAQPAWY